jgi:hypothetical protein
MTPAQLQTLHSAILADSTLNTYPNNSDGSWAMAIVLNQPASPAWTIWRKTLTPDMSRAAIVQGAAQLDNLTVGKREALLYLCQGELDCSTVGVRSAIDDLCGTQNTLKAAMVAAEKKLATGIEKILSTGTGSDAVPATCDWEGSVTYQEIDQARAL